MAVLVQVTHQIVVLIDTWWNVNKIKAKVFEEGKPSFNRYMVECEFYQKQLYLTRISLF